MSERILALRAIAEEYRPRSEHVADVITECCDAIDAALARVDTLHRSNLHYIDQLDAANKDRFALAARVAELEAVLREIADTREDSGLTERDRISITRRALEK